MDQYRVVSADGKEYGPVDLPGLLGWVRAGRVLKATLIRKGDAGPVPADTLPELADAFARASPPSSTIPPFATAVPLPAEFQSWAFIGAAWRLFKPHWLPLAVMALIMAVMGAVPYAGACVLFIIGGALNVGINRAILGMLAGTPPTVGMMFEGFDRFGQAFLATLVVAIFVSIGMVFLIVPGIILSLMWMFVLLVIAETDLDFWAAMKASADLTAGYRWKLFCLLLADFVILVAGFLCCGVGVLIAEPVVYISLALAYRFLQARHPAKAV